MLSRLVGLILTAIGLAVGWFLVLGPLREAQAGAQDVSYNIKSFVFAPLAIVAGLALLIGGGRVGEAFRGPPKGREQKTIVWIVMIIAFTATGLGWWWFDSQMTAFGYGP